MRVVTLPFFAALLATSSVCAMASWSRRAAAQEEDEEAPKAPPPVHAIPGSPIAYATRPRLAAERRFCALAAPICVHASATVPGRTVSDVLDAATRAWQTLGGALALPLPDLDPTTLAYPVYLVDDPDEAGETVLEARDVRSHYDRGRAFTRIDARVRAGCMLEALVTRELGRASLLRLAPATDPATALAQTTALARLVAPCGTALEGPDTAAFQKRPDRAITDAFTSDVRAATDFPGPPGLPSRRFARGGALFWQRLDWAYGRAPFSVIGATWALSPTATALDAARWSNEPDSFDVLRVSFKGALSTGSNLGDVLLDVAVARAFFGSADDGLHLPESRVFGDDARVTVDWDLAWPDKPTRLAPRAPVAPTGASYLVVRTGGKPNLRLRAEIVWEEHALFKWAFVKVDAQGRELGRVPIPTKERATEAQMSLVDLQGVDRVILVGANVGDPTYAFDPDESVWEPHGWLVTLAAE